MKKGVVLFLAVGFMALAAAIGPVDAAAGTKAGAELKTEAGRQSYIAGLRMEAIRQRYLAGLRMEAIRSGSAMPDTGASVGIASMWLTRVAAGSVNMVTNSVDESAGKDVKIDGKSYNVKGETGVRAMTKNLSIRFSRDPLTNSTVDKSAAAIFADASGRVYYFESPSTYREFLALSDVQVVYGYSKP